VEIRGGSRPMSDFIALKVVRSRRHTAISTCMHTRCWSRSCRQARQQGEERFDLTGFPFPSAAISSEPPRNDIRPWPRDETMCFPKLLAQHDKTGGPG
jgi:hypothetical protein